MLSTATIVSMLIITVFTGAIHSCELDLKGCPVAQHSVDSLPLTRLFCPCKSSVYFLQQLQGKILLRSAIGEEPRADQGSPMLLERYISSNMNGFASGIQAKQIGRTGGS